MKWKRFNGNLGALCLVVFSIFLLSTATSVHAATSVLHVNGTTGTDTSTCGTLASPCKTIGHTVNKRATIDSLINVAAGTYVESIVITKKNIALVGTGAATTSIVGNNTAPTISVLGPNRVEIRQVTIRNGNSAGIYAQSAYVASDNCVIRANVVGIRADLNCSLSIRGSTITSNQQDGINVARNSSAVIDSCKLTSNGGSGVTLDTCSSTDITKSNINYNQQNGVFLIHTSAGKIRQSNVLGNQNGVHVTMHSSVKLRGGNKVNSNAFAGINIQQGSQTVVQMDPDLAQADIVSSNGQGVLLGASSLMMFDGTVSGNNGNGIQLGWDSSGRFENGVRITTNDGWGLFCGDHQGDSKYSGTPTVSGNGLGQINCPQY